MQSSQSKSCCGSLSLCESEPNQSESAQWSQTWLKLGIAWVLAGQSACFSLAMNLTPPERSSKTYWVLHGLLVVSALCVCALLGSALIKAQVQALKQKRLTIEALFILSIVGALIGSLTASLTGQGSVYYEVVAIVLSIYTLGRMASERTRQKAFSHAKEMRAALSQAWIEGAEGTPHPAQSELSRVPLEAIQAGERVFVFAGEFICVDGHICAGNAWVDENALNGALEPCFKREGDLVYAGSHVVSGTLQLEAKALTGGRTIDQVLDTLEQAGQKDSKIQSWAQHLLKIFFPIVVLLGGFTFCYWLYMGALTQAILNAMSVLLVACPCALGLATPLAIWKSILECARFGIIAKNGVFIDGLAKANTLIFDKTGTLSKASLQVSAIEWIGQGKESESRLYAAIYALQSGFNHPIARAFCSASGIHQAAKGALPRVHHQNLIPGRGVEGHLEDPSGRFHLDILHDSEAAQANDASRPSKAYLCRVDGVPVARIWLAETLREDAEDTLASLLGKGYEIHILSGESASYWTEIAGIPVYSNMQPQDKVDYLESLHQRGRRTLFVGDGLNDAAVMSRADTALAMQHADQITRSTADGVLVQDALSPLIQGLDLAQQTYRRVKKTLAFSFTYNLVGMGLAAMGLLHPVIAALLMLGASLTVSITSLKSPRAATKATRPKPRHAMHPEALS